MIPETTAKLKIVRLTPPGRGAVAVLLLHGPDAVEIFSRHWIGPTVDSNDRQFFGRFRLGSGQVEEVVVFAPNRNEIEIHCHGGAAVTAAIEAVLVAEGAETVSWQGFFCPGTSQRELALKFLPLAPTQRCTQILLDQYNGVLERQETDRRRLEENAKLARHLVEPFRVVLAGPVNAGKSSLLNAVLGFQRAIVNPTPGTTRDTVSGRTALDGFPVEFIDTAGFRPLDNATEHDLERQGIQRSEKSLAEADLVLWVVDATSIEPDGVSPRRNDLLCLNKIDLLDDERAGRLKRKRSDAVTVSAVTGQGIETLLERIARRLVPNPPRPLEAVPLGELAKIPAK